ncbi:glycosyl transferase [Streptomyces viridochromogenes]|uniref:D-inositol 3-phosphate glycosyltransferase n=1 Tax=Streptomyces viridochromogenes TaxID=1938 RepID=A0A0J7Z484_STRVR|nr:glycosyltransferase [Streptomyces viridochromogenes]KMS70357.1 glycosyl transferase [Streptomyces viridochromogenes]KOG17113.1 glycosyl transferase [Streptomyces viridochromogenes]KOG20134.1 glycosyl transferase [Streptomyces viridochromogenes]
MRALHIITGLGVGGAEQQLRLLLRHLPAQCDVVTLTNPGSVAAGLAADGVRVAHLGMNGNRDVDALPRLSRLIRAGRYDLVHTHLYRACLYGRIAARLAGVAAVVATEHSIGDSRLEGRPLTAGVRALYLAGERLGRATVAVSPTVAQRLRHWGVPGPRIRVIPNGIDAPLFRFDEVRRKEARAFHGLPEDAYVVGGVGRLAPGKRFDLLVRALHQLPDGVRLLLVGTGPEEAALRRTAHRLGVADRVVLTGERPYLPGPGDDAPGLAALLSAMDVLASPSPEESFGLAVVEALAAGLPVLYASCPAVDDLPPDAVPGARRVRGGAESYARELLRLRAVGPAERTVPDVVHRYDIAGTARQLMDLYTAALSGSNLEVSSS